MYGFAPERTAGARRRVKYFQNFDGLGCGFAIAFIADIRPCL